jgi:acyl-coenzyme A thioesterase PaaI-like protein
VTLAVAEGVQLVADDPELSTALDGQMLPVIEPNARLERLARELRAVQDSVIGTVAPNDVIDAVIEQLADIDAQLQPYSLSNQPTNGWDDTRRSAHTRTFAPVLEDVRVTDHQMSARLTLSSFYLGANGAAHGGSIPLIFDQALAQLAQYRRSISRTAYLNVSYRAVTPVLKPLRIEGRLERIDGRKRFVHGTIRDGDVVTAEADALYVALRPGQA